MRLPLYTLFLSLATLFSLSPPVHSIHPHALSRRAHGHSSPPYALTSRQHHVARDLLDICINADLNLGVDVSQILDLGSLLGPTDLGTTVHLCLCLKDLNIYLETNDDIQALVTLLGKNVVSALITALIDTSPDAKQCTFPPNAHHTCNNSDPCHYECDTNYVRNGDTCVCAPPNISCNGVCGSFPKGCGSAVPAKKRAEPIRTLAQAKAACKPHEAVCGVSGGVGAFAFECIDISTTKDSCGGCMVPHPFVDEAPGHQTVGKDCGNISNVKSSTCSAKKCIVHSCQNGWLPDPTKEECLSSSTGSRMRRVRRSALPLVVNATSNANIDSGLVTQLVAIVDAVLGLGVPQANSTLSPVPASTSSSSTFSTISAIYSLFNDVRRATGNLIASSTVSEFLAKTDNLLDTSALLKSMLNDCRCIHSLGLSEVSAELTNLIASVSTMQNWCSHNSIIPGSTIPSSDSPHQPIVIGLTDLLADLGLNGKSGASVNGLGNSLSSSANGLLDDASLGLNNYKRTDVANIGANATINSDLLAKIVALVDLIINLRGDTTSLPVSSTTANLSSPSSPTSTLDVNGLVNSILIATVHILNSSTSSSLTSSIDYLAQTLTEVNSLLSQCECIDGLGLDILVADLERIVIGALDVQSLCHGHPILSSPYSSSTHPATPLSSSSSPTASPAASSDVPIVVGLSDLLSDLGLLGPVKSSVAVAGLESGLSDSINKLLDGLDIGPANARRDVDSNLSADVNGTAAINSQLRSLLEGLVDLVLDLEDSMSSLPPPPASDASTSSLNANSVLGVAHSLAQLLQSKTVGALLANVDAFVDAVSALQDRFTSCACAESLGLEQASKYLQLVGEAAVGLQTWCASNSIVASGTPANPSPTSLGPLLPTGGGPMVKPPAARVSATTSPIALPTPVTSSPRPSTSTSSAVSGDTHIIIGLDYLLARLGLGTGVVTVDGLGDGVDSTINGLSNDLSIGPDDVRRRGVFDWKLVKRQGLLREREEKRQISITAISNATVDSDLLVQIEALVNLILGLNSAATSLAPAAPSTPTASATATPSLPTSSISSSISSGSTYTIDSCLVDSIINTTIALLSSETYEELLEETNALVSASTLSLTTLEGCDCVKDLGLDSLYGYLIQIVDASLALQDLCHSHTPPPLGPSPSAGTPSIPLPTPIPATSSTPGSSNNTTTSGGDEPLVIGLTKLLQGFGINADADVVVDKLLGNSLDHTVNSVLNDLGIGPNGARRRLVARVDES
ncbi:hypothetical protein BJ912DRAFT_251831 [Pholiota molesta]|nr:hypothetical protein BJ912DRAFT_251831 [Pholiota molesta]